MDFTITKQTTYLRLNNNNRTMPFQLVHTSLVNFRRLGLLDYLVVEMECLGSIVVVL